MKRLRLALGLLAVPLAAIAQRLPQDALHAAGPQSADFLDLWRFTLVLCCVVFALVLAAFLIALWRSGRGTAATPADVSGLQQPEPRLQRRVSLAVALSALGLLVLTGASVWTDRRLAELPLRDAIQVKVTGRQWWWQLTYFDQDPTRTFEAANELHVPVGRPVLLTLQSDDVIHSFWLPNLAGKKDLIPGRTAQLQFRADQPGIYRGQCAEFCGLQHAWMAFVVIADPPEQYAAWEQAQRLPPSAPKQAQLARGRSVFLSGTCAMCHTVQGTEAQARNGPDLSHVGSRRTIAAGTLPNDTEHLSDWIRDPQRFKPGANMPSASLSDDDLAALTAYLQSLK